MKKLLLILIFFPLILSAQTTYFVKNGGNNGNTGLSDAQAWETIGKVNSVAFVAGDSIKFKRGSTWSEVLVADRSGSAGSPVTYTSYGTGAKPIITCQGEVPGWTTAGNWTQSGSKWTMTYAPGGPAPKRLWLDSVEKSRPATSTVTALRPWYWASNVLHIYSATNPATAFASIKTEQQRIYCVQMDAAAGIHYNTFSNLNLRYGYASMLSSSADHVVIDSCNFSGYYGLIVTGYLTAETGEPCTDGVIKNCTFDVECTQTGGTFEAKYTENGLHISQEVSDWDIYDNTFKDHGHTSIYIFNNTNTAYTESDILIHDNYFTSPNTDYGRSISVDYINGTGNKIYNNLIYNIPTVNQINGPNLEFYCNIINTVRSYPWAGAHAADGISLSGYWPATKPNTGKYYNNVIANCVGNGISIGGAAGFANKYDNEFVNNIIYNCDNTSGYQLWIIDHATVLDNVYKNNLMFKTGVADLIYYGQDPANDYPHTIAEFNAENGDNGNTISNNIGGDPTFVGAADFHLQAGSPAIGVGLGVGLVTDYDGDYMNEPPDIGAYAYNGTPPIPPEIPTITTTLITYNAISAIITGEVIVNDGTLTGRGICWSTSVNPTTANNKTSDGISGGSISVKIFPLAGGTTYHVRAYATNESGTGYGADIEILTPAQTPITSGGKILKSGTKNLMIQ